MMVGPANILNNVDIFNNQDGLFMQPTISQSNNFNKVSVYNNTRGIIATSSLNNTYNGLNMFANATPFVGTNGSDGQLAVTIGYSWAAGAASTLNGTGIMTCNRAIQATNLSGQNVLQYPYCNTRGVNQAWTPSAGVQYTFFPNIYKQTQAVKYGFPGPIVANTGTYISTMFVGDFAYAGTTPF